VWAAAACEREQHRPGGFGLVLWPAAGTPDGLAAVGELQAEAEGSPGCGQVTRSAGQVVFGRPPGRIRAVMKISMPSEKADIPVTATATSSVRPSTTVPIATMPGSSPSGLVP
jgi:hypothetical protein